MPTGGKNSKIINTLSQENKAKLDALPKLHFGAYTLDTIAISQDPNNPTYLTGVGLFPTSSAEFTLIDPATGLIRNDSDRVFSMQGTVTYQTAQGAGGSGELKLWSERSGDDGVTFTENPFSLRTSEVPNNSTNSQTKSSGVDQWEPGQSIRWAMYNSGAGAVSLDGPTATVNNGNVINGLSLYWQLNEV